MSGAGAPDFFYKEAQRLGYVARSAFKVCCFFSLSPLLFLCSLWPFAEHVQVVAKPTYLMISSRLSYCAFLLEEQLLQMQKQYKLIKPGSSVLDLGCAPGAWLQVCACDLFQMSVLWNLKIVYSFILFHDLN